MNPHYSIDESRSNSRFEKINILTMSESKIETFQVTVLGLKVLVLLTVSFCFVHYYTVYTHAVLFQKNWTPEFYGPSQSIMMSSNSVNDIF